MITSFAPHFRIYICCDLTKLKCIDTAHSTNIMLFNQIYIFHQKHYRLLHQFQARQEPNVLNSD
ncbi:hypothetical protein Hanom_Chr03g00204471 [Helianthus anomalus]